MHKAIGLLGGTFNPIHYGHLFLAEEARVQFKLDLVLFIPNYLPPHRKTQNEIFSYGEERFMMSLLATLSNPFFQVSRIELDRKGISFTIDTVAALKKASPLNRYYFICGSDSLSQYRWHRFQDLMEILDGLLVAPRQGEGIKEIKRKIKKEFPYGLKKLQEIQMTPVEISATLIRKRIQERKNIRYLVPETVAQFIEQYKLYHLPNL